MLRKKKLGTQFTVVLTLVFLGGIVSSGLVLSEIMQREAEEDITTKAEILMQTMDSVRNYTTNQVAPLLEDRSEKSSHFTREMVPAFAASKVFDQFRSRPKYKNFLYKEAASNPTNPQDQADEFESQLIQQFRDQSSLTERHGYRSINGEKLFYIARPMTVNQASCLQCHGSSEVAPKSLIASFGTQGGFGWRLNEIVASQTIYVPADAVFKHRRQFLGLVMFIVCLIFTSMMCLLNGLLKRRVIQPINELTAIAHRVSTGMISTGQVGQSTSFSIHQISRRVDEPGQLARAFQRMARELAAREQNLAYAVEQRTAQLAEATQEAEKARTKAEEANQIKSQFLSNMSHELRTPLNVILGFTQLLLRNGSLARQQQHYLDTINRSGEHLLKLINDVLDISKIEAGRTTLNENSFDFRALLDWLQQMFQLKAESKGLNLYFDVSSDLPRYIYTDEGKLRQVLLNLLGNAIKFTEAGQVRLKVSRVDPLSLNVESVDLSPDLSPQGAASMVIHFEVADSGPGIAPEELSTLFKPFVQAEAGRNSLQGTGLGLAISWEYVHLMGGDITVESQLGVGTVFQFHIWVRPVEEDELETQSVRQQVISLEPGQPAYRILIAEDKPENRQLMMDLLKPVGFEVREATNGQDAIALWQSWSPHLIWMDIRMPIMNGFEAAQQIKNSNQNSPIIIALTGSAFEEDRQIALQKGYDDFVRKPFQVETIFEKMAKHLGVRYRYARSTALEVNGENAPKAPPSLLQPGEMKKILTEMPTEWIKQLHEAAIRVNAKQILSLIEHTPELDQAFAHTLVHLTQECCFDEIITITTEFWAG
jgi:signal transduction histidine kinase/CheY-like chemotaxis protein